jgi:hypothetical protein
MKAIRVLIAALVIAGVAGSLPAASARKHHHKSHSMSMKKDSGTGMNNGMKDPNAMPNKDATGQGTVGPGSNNGAMKK